MDPNAQVTQTYGYKMSIPIDPLLLGETRIVKIKACGEKSMGYRSSTPNPGTRYNLNGDDSSFDPCPLKTQAQCLNEAPHWCNWDISTGACAGTGSGSGSGMMGGDTGSGKSQTFKATGPTLTFQYQAVSKLSICSVTDSTKCTDQDCSIGGVNNSAAVCIYIYHVVSIALIHISITNISIL